MIPFRTDPSWYERYWLTAPPVRRPGPIATAITSLARRAFASITAFIERAIAGLSSMPGERRRVVKPRLRS
jgi:hypothetical protein